MASHAFLAFKISPGVARPPHKNRYTGKFWISLFYSTSVPRRLPHPHHHTGAKHVDICWASAYDYLWFCDPTGFICSLQVELPLPPPFFSYIYTSAWIRLLLCNGRSKFPGFYFVCVFFFFFFFCVCVCVWFFFCVFFFFFFLLEAVNFID